ncbi:transglutaminase-like domain-containing protein [Lacrimispora saccharolytica]|uniref:Transglutaminase domain protein n=1 Tax=Lacrimispora saccharolytica (strain ATCC 35040 / DSM 2544 / NRCC 2533 / WM1) TaxID=610130 RepID=D9R375_LACSW|nr:transglutaminase-like domain-containing protein [Lacrimispora saccharolytica]ADL04824.1 transglutaminase domain protein [[Clostridium] saccharolyticum WM1]QRV20965.1 transglutaminase domain-containing protein [Lacrimispora saccharolytica]
MFSEHLQRYAQEKYDLRLPFLGGLKGEIEAAMGNCTPREQVLMKFLYGTMPLRDAGEYDFAMFLGFVRHSIMVYDRMEWCREIPEDIFLHHILYYRINTENIEDCRGFFYDKLIDRVKGLSVREAVIEINYWCAENGTYEASDNRTISPVTVYKSGKGRCGEESTFAVTAFRSVGIPARQVYTPRWAHCDDNHAWVEVYVEGKWHFLGACEPEEVLDKGWFTNASSRALLVHTRTFSDYSGDSAAECLGHDDLMVYYNDTATYALTRPCEIQVLDEDRNPVENVHVSFEILNMAEYCSVVNLYTDGEGKVSVTIGLGDIHVRAMKDGLSCEAWISPEDGVGTVLILTGEREKLKKDVWKDTDVRAPKDYPMNPVILTKEQKERNRKRIHEANQMRENRINGYFKKEVASQYPEEAEILRLSAGNFAEIYKFLTKDQNPYRKALLHSLSVKDYKDARADILESHLKGAAPYSKEWEEYGDPAIYEKYILCPRILLEEMTDYRGFIEDFFNDNEKEGFRKHPGAIWEYINQHISFEPKLDYKTICSTPKGSLKLLQSNPLSQRILFVAICRTLGIPSRINPVNLEAEVYKAGSFVSIFRADEIISDNFQESGKLVLLGETDSLWTYYQTWTIGRLNGGQFTSLDYTGLKFADGVLTLDLGPGIYRLITSVRLPSGNQNASEYVFELKKDEEKTVTMRLRSGNLEDMLVETLLDDFEVTVSEENGIEQTVPASVLTEGKANILAILSEGQEPTEHVLNEMLEQKDALTSVDARIIFLLQGKFSLKNRTIGKVLETIPGIKVGYINFDDTVEPLARRMYVDPEKLPLLIVTDPGMKAIYGCSGYNVGSVDLMVKLLGLSRNRL